MLGINLLRGQFCRYLIVGAFNTLLSYGIYALMLAIGLHFRFASLISLIIGIGISFLTQGSIVFGKVGRSSLVRFVLSWVMIYFVNIGFLGVLTKAGLSAYLAGAVATVPVALISYFVLKLLVFRS